MPDKHEVGGSSPLGPTSRTKQDNEPFKSVSGFSRAKREISFKGGSSPLGPTREVKDKIKAVSRTERPRAFVERAEYLKGTETVKCKGRGVQENAEASARHKHRHVVISLLLKSI